MLTDLITKNFKGFNFLKKIFPLHYNVSNNSSSPTTEPVSRVEPGLARAGTSDDFSSSDENPQQSPSATRTHVEKPYFLNEQSTLNMVEILKKMVTRYLQLLGNLVNNKDEFENMVKIASGSQSAQDDRKGAEEYIKEQSRIHGELIVQVKMS